MKQEFAYTKQLHAFIQKVDESLTKSPMYQWQYATDKWNTELIRAENSDILDQTTNKTGVYAIFVQEKLVYIGQVQSQGARACFQAHFISKDPRTGSKLEQVKLAVAKKLTVGFSFVEIDPAELRHLIEEKLIRTHSPSWNLKGVTKSKTPKTSSTPKKSSAQKMPNPLKPSTTLRKTNAPNTSSTPRMSNAPKMANGPKAPKRK
jgi:hypothetical protein